MQIVFEVRGETLNARMDCSRQLPIVQGQGPETIDRIIQAIFYFLFWDAFYEAFEPDRARAYIKRLNFCYTPKHGSWLNVAECELSCLTSQCLSDRRIGELSVLQTEIAAWSDKTNNKQRGVDWQFRIENARVKLKRLYPKIKA